MRYTGWIMRIIKEPEVRKNEILDAAEELFGVKGYGAATVNDILEAVNIAKGTFYYYFKSKEDVLDALIERRVHDGVEKAKEIIASPLSPVEKFLGIVMAQKPQNKIQKEFNSALHEKDNSKMHQKALARSVLCLGPCLGQVIEEGIGAGIFSTPFPKESAEILLSAALVLFDEDFFQWSSDEGAAKIAAFLCTMERTLGAKAGTLSDFARVFA